MCFGIRSFHFPSPPLSEENHTFWHADALRSFSSSSSTSSSSLSRPLIVLFLISAYKICESLSVWSSDVVDRLLFYFSTLAVNVKSSSVHLEPQITNACVHPCICISINLSRWSHIYFINFLKYCTGHSSVIIRSDKPTFRIVSMQLKLHFKLNCCKDHCAKTPYSLSWGVSIFFICQQCKPQRHVTYK